MDQYDGERPIVRNGIRKKIYELPPGESFSRVSRMDISYGYNPAARKKLVERSTGYFKTIQAGFKRRYPKREYIVEQIIQATKEHGLIIGGVITRLK